MFAEEQPIGTHTHLACWLGHQRLSRDIEWFRNALDERLRIAGQQAQRATRDLEREAHWQDVLAQRESDLMSRVVAPREQKLEQAQAERERLAEMRAEEMQSRKRAEEARQRAFAEQQQEHAIERATQAECRVANARVVALRGEALQAERVAEDTRRQDELACRRADMQARLFEQRAQSAAGRRIADEEKQARLLAHVEEEQRRLDDKASAYADKVGRICRKEARRDELLREAEKARAKAALFHEKAREVLQQASEGNYSDVQALRARFEELVVLELSTPPATPRSVAKLPRNPASSPASPSRWSMSATSPKIRRSSFGDAADGSTMLTKRPSQRRPSLRAAGVGSPGTLVSATAQAGARSAGTPQASGLGPRSTSRSSHASSSLTAQDASPLDTRLSEQLACLGDMEPKDATGTHSDSSTASTCCLTSSTSGGRMFTLVDPLGFPQHLASSSSSIAIDATPPAASAGGSPDSPVACASPCSNSAAALGAGVKDLVGQGRPPDSASIPLQPQARTPLCYPR
uniref:Uncharacterized protein n=1 Tax=Zooxanthella nutricula TaxID=1333877 RepID=A0A7S2I9D9_9DINO